MAKTTKRRKSDAGKFDGLKNYKLNEAIDILKGCQSVKFDASVDLQMKLGADPNASTQNIRGTTLLPHGTGKKIRVVVLSKDDKGKAAMDAGADVVGGAELVDKIAGGWLDFDVVIASPAMMRDAARLGKVLGPRGLMPSPKAGTVAEDVEQAVKDVKKGRIEFKMDKQANLHCQIGRLSFDTARLAENAAVLFASVLKSKPKDVKGNLILSAAISSTMGPGLKIDKSEFRESESAE